MGLASMADFDDIPMVDEWDPPDIEYVAFAVKGDNTIDIERYRASVDMDTNAADFVYDGERVTLHTLQLVTYTNFVYDLWAAGWTVGPIEESATDFQAPIMRIIADEH